MIIFLTCVRYHQSSTETSLNDLWHKTERNSERRKSSGRAKTRKAQAGWRWEFNTIQPQTFLFFNFTPPLSLRLSCLNKTWREYSTKLSPFHVWWYCKNRKTMWWRLVFFLKRELAFSPMNNMRSIIYFWNSCRNSSDLARSLVESHCQ